MIRYKVKPGDTINSIARRFGICIGSIFAVNQGLDKLGLIAGRKIAIPLSMYRYAVYDIRGTSTKLTDAQMRSLIAGRRRTVELASKNPGEMYINGPTTENIVALTFDDGPDSYVTPRVLDILKANSVKANFFFIGSQIGAYTKVVKRAYDEGHLILNHGFSHPHFTEIDEQGIRSQILSTEKKILNIIGRRPSLLRPPYGETNEKVISASRSTGNKIIIWSCDSMDWVPGVDKQTVINNVLNNVRPGEIIIMHSGPAQRIVIDALQEIIVGLKRRGFRIVDLGELLGVNPYK